MQRDKQPDGPGALCPTCGKIRHFSRKAALRFGRNRYPGETIRAYRACPAEWEEESKFWHVTSQDAASIKWFKDQAEGNATPAFRTPPG